MGIESQLTERKAQIAGRKADYGDDFIPREEWAEYTAWRGMPTRLACELRLTMRPYLRSSMPRPTAWVT